MTPKIGWRHCSQSLFWQVHQKSAAFKLNLSQDETKNDFFSCVVKKRKFKKDVNGMDKNFLSKFLSLSLSLIYFLAHSSSLSASFFSFHFPCVFFNSSDIDRWLFLSICVTVWWTHQQRLLLHYLVHFFCVNRHWLWLPLFLFLTVSRFITLFCHCYVIVITPVCISPIISFLAFSFLSFPLSLSPSFRLCLALITSLRCNLFKLSDVGVTPCLSWTRRLLVRKLCFHFCFCSCWCLPLEKTGEDLHHQRFWGNTFIFNLFCPVSCAVSISFFQEKSNVLLLCEGIIVVFN